MAVVVQPVQRALGVVREFLPRGQLLPQDVWRHRHRTLTNLLRAHVVGLFAFALVRGYDPAHAAFEAGLVAIFAVMASMAYAYRRLSSSMTALGLVTSSAVLVHLSGGTVEAHFHFFVMVGILTLYQDWLPFLLAIGYVVLHHGIIGTLTPEQVYNHPAAIAQPFKWAVIHAVFVLGASVASIVAWRLNEEQALRDALTKLPNRRLFQDRVGHALARVRRTPSRIAVLFVDLDDFKNINDTLGHAAGDQLLVTIAERLRACLRASDTAARLGGDEFAVLIEDTRSVDDATVVARRILDALDAPFCLRGKEIVVTASVGVALNGVDDDVEDLLRNADVAMYSAKSGVKGGYEVFESSMQVAVVDRLNLEADLGRALAEREFVVHYQPLVNLESGKIAGVEALVRWMHPDRGLLLPAEFIEVAEETGDIVAVGAWVLEQACADAAAWQRRYPDESFSVSVNLSPRQLETDVVETVRSVLRRTGLRPQSLVLEVTEGVMMFDSEETLAQLNSLKALGVQLAIDDFGTGYSSLSYLRRLPFDILKIDKLFIDGIAGGPAESAFARAIMKLAMSLELQTVAEGVEESSQVSALRELDCAVGQGYFFAKPLAAEGIEALLGTANAANGWLAVDSYRGPQPQH